MLGDTMNRIAEASAAQAARVPAQTRLYVVGDVHGRMDLLDALVEKIGDDLLRGQFENAATVFLGDYIDRGPHSAQVVERLASDDFPTSFIALRGNHEAEFLDFLQDASVLENWRRYGGLETLVSYGVDVSAPMCGKGYGLAQRELARKLPAHHLAFLRRTRLSYSCGDYFFCHAGVRPGVPLEEQNSQDLLWIRRAFTDYRGPIEKVVVHGHTPVEAPAIMPNRIAIDTGAYATGVLTCLVLQDDERRFMAT